MKRRIWIPIAIVLLLMIIAGATWAIRSREAPEVTEVRELAKKMFDRENVTDEERSAIRERMREIGDELPEEQRREVFREMGNQFQQRMSEHIREFAALPLGERNAFLDRDIARMEEMRKSWETRRRQRGDRSDRDGQRGRGDRGGGFRGPGGTGGPGGRDGRPRTEEDRDARRRARLDNRSVEDRAHMTEYFKAMNERREERGLEPMRRFGRGGR
jgi:uncharacterized membrane protein YgcG